MQRIVASGFGVGLIPRALLGVEQGAGTLGAALGAAVSLLLMPLGWGAGLAAAATATAISLWASAPFAEDDGGDPNWVVIDEVAGTLVALVGLSGWAWAVALAVARAGDITKLPPGVGAAERLPGSLGVTADDIVAGGYGLAVGWLVTGLG